MVKSASLIASFNAGEWSPLLWNRLDLARHAAACRRMENFLPLAQGAATRRPGTRYIASTRDDGIARLVPFEFSVEQAYMLEFSHRSLRLFRSRAALAVEPVAAPVANGTFDAGTSGWDDISIGDGAVGWNAGGWLEIETGTSGTGRAEQAVTTDAPDATHVLVFELKRDQHSPPGGCTIGIGSSSAGVTIATRSTGEPGFHALSFVPGVSTLYVNFAVGNGPGRKLGIDNVAILSGPAFELPTPYDAAELAQLKWTQSADVLYLTHPDHPPMKLSRLGALDWSLTEILFADGPYLPSGTVGTVSAAATSGVAVAVSCDAAIFQPGDRGRLLRLRHDGTWGWGVITAVGDGSNVTVDVMQAFGGTGPAGEYRLGAWSQTTGYPACISFFEERLFLAGTRTRPQTVWGSVVGDYENQAPSKTDGTVLSDSAVTFTIADDRVNAIRWMSAGKTLAIGTAGGEFTLSAAGVNESVTPSSVNVRRETTKGSADLQPVRIGPAVLFVQRARRRLNELTYDFQADALLAPDLSLMAQHLMEPALAEVTYQAEPWSIVWCVREDGALLGLTYLRDQQVAGWHRHAIGGGRVRSAAVIPAATQDELWLVVEREIGGATRRFVEVMEVAFKPAHAQDHAGAFHVDAGLTYDGWNADPLRTLTLSGAGPWSPGESKTLTAAGHAPFAMASVGRRFLLGDDGGGSGAEVEVTGYASATAVAVTLVSAVPAGLQDAPTASWAIMAQLLTGLDHLEGVAVAIAADGAAHPARLVEDGAVSLDHAAARVHVGIGYASALETLDLEAGLPQARRRRIHEVAVRIVDTLGARVGPSEGPLEQLPFRNNDAAMNRAPALFTGEKSVPFPKGWDRAARLAVVQEQPLPCTIAAVVARISSNEG